MPTADENVAVYRELADWYERHGQPQLRDRFLVLAADTALAEGFGDEAERLRLRLLRGSPHHLLKPFGSFAEALKSPDVQSYVRDLRRSYPVRVALGLLESLRAGAPASPGRAAHALPPTAPEIDLFPGPGHAPPGVEEPTPEVYRLREEEEPPGACQDHEPPRPHVPPPRPKPMTQLPPAAGQKPSSALPAGPRLNESPFLRTLFPPPPEEPARPRGGWAPTVLFFVVLALGLAWAGFTLLRPFLGP